MATPVDPRPRPSKKVEDVPVTLVDPTSLDAFEVAIRNSISTAIDTETAYTPQAFVGPNAKPGALRVISAATRNSSEIEQAWVLDIKALDPLVVASILSGTSADAWNADFDARVLDRDLFEPAKKTRDDIQSISWWDAQLADALLHQGRTGFSFYHGLAWAVEWYLGLNAEGKGTTQLSYNLSLIHISEPTRPY